MFSLICLMKQENPLAQDKEDSRIPMNFPQIAFPHGLLLIKIFSSRWFSSCNLTEESPLLAGGCNRKWEQETSQMEAASAGEKNDAEKDKAKSTAMEAGRQHGGERGVRRR
jgi:hypothetical protein